jgi:hypothetical protein
MRKKGVGVINIKKKSTTQKEGRGTVVKNK